MPPFPENPRNIVFFGESGVGKSSTINLLLGSGTLARVTNDADPCTQEATPYETTLNDEKYTLWDTRGLGEGFLRNILSFRASSESQLEKFLKERHKSRGIDLLVYCARGSRATKASAKYYKKFCVTTRQLAVPVVILVTQLERERNNMEEWWNRNSPELKKLKMEFDDHACITTLLDDPRTAESRERLVDLIIKTRRRQVQRNASSVSPPAQTSIPSSPPPRGGLFRSLFKRKYDVDSGAPDNGPSSNSDSSSTAASRTSYYTAESPAGSVPASPISAPPSPIVVPPTPRSATAESIGILPISRNNTDPLEIDGPQSSGGETSSMDFSLYSRPHSSNTSLAPKMSTQSGTDGSEDHSINEIPSTSIQRRMGYASRHGAFGDIWECDLISEGSSAIMVAVKAVKLDTDEPDDQKSHEKKLRRELRIWKGLQHRNIVQLLGVVSGFGPLSSMVSPWFRNGSLSHHLEHNRLPLSEKHRLLEDIATGLSYLHSRGIIHGDLHSDNVLIDDDGRACLTDFGLSLIVEFVGTSYLKSSVCGAVSFADPVLVKRVHDSLEGQVIYPTMPCDVYSFGGLLLHVLSQKRPYDGVSPTEIVVKVLAGERPNIPTHNDVTPHEPLIQRCWDPEEHKRPLANSELVAEFTSH